MSTELRQQERSENTFIINTINPNTRIFHTGNLSELTYWELQKFPEKVKNRLIINTEGINNLSTTIITPEARKSFIVNQLPEILDFSKTVNDSIGLPTTGELIIRSARERPFRRDNSNTHFSEPALLVSEIGTEDEKYKLLVDGNLPRNFQSLEQFFSILNPDTYLMIHDDNVPLQKQSVQGRLRISEDNCELIFGTDTKHPRGMGTSASDAPFIRFNSQFPEYLFKAEPQFIERFLNEKVHKTDFPRLTIYSERLSSDRGAYILKQIQANQNDLLHYYQRATKCFGSNSVMEFRIYPPTGMENQQRLHVLDVNNRF